MCVFYCPGQLLGSANHYVWVICEFIVILSHL